MTPDLARTATIRTRFDDGVDPTIILEACRPDNTDEMTTRLECDGDERTLVTTIERDATGGLQATLDDYLVNLDVANTVAQCGDRFVRPDRPNASARTPESNTERPSGGSDDIPNNE